jgi:hypothetical protein
MADELNSPNHRWYEPRNNIALAPSDYSKHYIFDSGIQKIDAWINGGDPTPTFTPSTLYSSGATGIWLDPSDLSTMFSDRAGTTPVTTPGTVVGLRLDKSKGLVPGAELVTNGTFDSGTTGWGVTQTSGTATLTASSGIATLTNPAASVYATAHQGFTTVVGRTYKVTGQLISASGATLNALRKSDSPGGGSNDVTIYGGSGALVPGTGAGYFLATATTSYVLVQVNGASNTITFDNISVREIAGNHAVAPTDAARPIYGVEPKGGRRNLLTYSEQFDNAAWTKAAVTVTANASVAPDGTTTADLLLPTTANADHYLDVGLGLGIAAVSGTQYSLSVSAKANGYRWLRLAFSSSIMPSANRVAWFDLQTGTLGTVQSGVTATITAQANGFYRCSIARDATASATPGQFGFIQVTNADNSSAFAANGTDSILIWGAQLELGSAATPYQRVTTAYDITESGVPTCHYVQYDGSDDSMSTAAIDFTATDKMSVFAGVRKTGTALSVLAELSSTGANAGAFTLQAPFTAAPDGYQFGASGTTFRQASAVGYTAPISNILTGLGDISGDLVTLRIDGTQEAQTTTDLGTGNYGNYPLFFGRRNNATLPFSGKDYGIIVVGKAASAGEISDTELWLSDKTAEVDVAKSISPNIYTRAGDTILTRANSIIERRA